MSETFNPEAFQSQAQKLDLNALADAFAAKGDLKEAQRLREQAQRQAEKQAASKPPEETIQQYLERFEQQRTQEIAANISYEVPPPQDPLAKAETVDVKGMADALAARGDLKGAAHFYNMAEKAQRPSQRPVRPPETK